MTIGVNGIAVDTIKVKLITNNEGNFYGFRIDEVDTHTTEQPVGQNLYESWHDYANNYQSTWVISQPGADQVRLHFTKLELGSGDKLQFLDEDDKVLKTYAPGNWDSVLLENDYWSEWYSVGTIKVKLITNNEEISMGSG